MALKFQIHKILQALKGHCNRKTGCNRTAVIDIPFSLTAYKNFFVSKIFKLNIGSNKSIRMNLTVNELKPVLGRNWNILRCKKSSTVQKVLGMISINYRQKNVEDISSGNKR